MITFLLGFLPFMKFAQMGLDIGYNLIIKLLGLIFYLASEYWGRWVLFAIIIACLLLYGRAHYINQGKAQEAHFCEIRIEDAQRPKASAPLSIWPLDDLFQ